MSIEQFAEPAQKTQEELTRTVRILRSSERAPDEIIMAFRQAVATNLESLNLDTPNRYSELESALNIRGLGIDSLSNVQSNARELATELNALKTTAKDGVKYKKALARIVEIVQQESEA